MALSVLLGNLLSKRVDALNPPTIYTDSQLMFGQLTQGSKVRAKNLFWRCTMRLHCGCGQAGDPP